MFISIGILDYRSVCLERIHLQNKFSHKRFTSSTDMGQLFFGGRVGGGGGGGEKWNPGTLTMMRGWNLGYPDQTQVSFAQYEPCDLLKNGTKLDVGSQIQPIQIRSGQFCTIWTMCSLEKQNWIGCGKSDLPIQIRSGSVLHNMNRAFSGKTELNWMWEVGSGPFLVAHWL